MQEAYNVSSVEYKFSPVPTICPHCHESVTTCVDSKFNERGRIDRTFIHNCPKCNKFIAKFKPDHSGEMVTVVFLTCVKVRSDSCYGVH